MGAWHPSHMQSLIFARIRLHGEMGIWPLNLLTKVTDLTLESLDMMSEALVSVVMPAASHSHTLSAVCASLRERRSSAEGSMRGSSGHSRRTVSAAAAIGRAAVGCAQLNSTIVAQGEPRGGGRELSTCNES